MTKTRLASSLAGMALAAAFALSACSGPQPSQEQQTNAEARSASWARTYDNYDAVLRETTLVVVATAATQEKISSIEDGTGPKDSTLTTFQVTRALGEAAEDVKVRSTDGLPGSEAASYTVGQKYVLFLQPFEFQRGVPTGSFITVGQLAAYKVDGDLAVRITSRDALPLNTTMSDLLDRAASVIK